jgi:hypothetical protein
MSRLLRDSMIYSAKNASLFDTLLTLRSDVEENLRVLGMELVVVTDAGVAHARNMSDEQLDAMADEMDCEPISPVCGHNRLSYYDSVAVIHFRMSLDQELRQGGEEIWLNQNEVFEGLAKHYSEAVCEDRIALDARITKCLSRLVDMKLLNVRSMGKSSLYRGTPLMRVAFSRDALSEFVEQMGLLADAEGGAPKEDKEPLVKFDTLEPAA